MSNAAGCAKLIQALAGVDVLVNNMGIFGPKPFEEIPDEDWLRLFEANVMSGVRLSRHYLSGMREKQWGRILFVSSESAVQIPAEMVHYGMTKTAQVAVARGIAESVAGTGITVNSVLAGPTRSEGVETFIAQMGAGGDSAAFEAEFFQTVRPTSLLKRFSTIDEVANLIVYLCSPLASATTGSALPWMAAWCEQSFESPFPSHVSALGNDPLRKGPRLQASRFRIPASLTSIT